MSLQVHLWWRCDEVSMCMHFQKGVFRTLSVWHGQVTLVLAAARSRRRPVWVWVLPLVQDLLRLGDELLRRHQSPYSQHYQPRCPCTCSYSLLSRLGDVLVRFEEGANVDSLATPEVSVDSPVEGKLQGAAVKVTCACQYVCAMPMGCRGCLQDFGSRGHDERYRGLAPSQVTLLPRRRRLHLEPT